MPDHPAEAPDELIPGVEYDMVLSPRPLPEMTDRGYVVPDLAAIRARCEAATGHLRIRKGTNRTVETTEPGGFTGVAFSSPQDAEFYVHARDDIPALLALVDAQAERLARALEEMEYVAQRRDEFRAQAEQLDTEMDQLQADLAAARRDLEEAEAVHCGCCGQMNVVSEKLAQARASAAEQRRWAERMREAIEYILEAQAMLDSDVAYLRAALAPPEPAS